MGWWMAIPAIMSMLGGKKAENEAKMSQVNNPENSVLNINKPATGDGGWQSGLSGLNTAMNMFGDSGKKEPDTMVGGKKIGYGRGTPQF